MYFLLLEKREGAHDVIHAETPRNALGRTIPTSTERGCSAFVMSLFYGLLNPCSRNSEAVYGISSQFIQTNGSDLYVIHNKQLASTM
jgi:hypothetical protein